MQDDPFARAVDRMKATERAEADERRRRVQRHATRHVRSGARTALRVHASVFLAVNLLLLAIWLTTTRGYPWFLWPLLGWGIGLVAHWSATANLTARRRRSATSGVPYGDERGFGSERKAAYADPVAPRGTHRGGGQVPAGGSTADELDRLAALRESGVLSAKEFKAAKAKLLG